MLSRRSRRRHFPDILVHSDWPSFLFLKIPLMWFDRLNWMGCRVGGGIVFDCVLAFLVVLLLLCCWMLLFMRWECILLWFCIFLSAITNLSIFFSWIYYLFLKCCHRCWPVCSRLPRHIDALYVHVEWICRAQTFYMHVWLMWGFFSVLLFFFGFAISKLVLHFFCLF